MRFNPDEMKAAIFAIERGYGWILRQVRYPRSKKKRTQKKWQRRIENYNMVRIFKKGE